MDKVLSTRLDEAVIVMIERLAHDRRIPKKRVLEEAVRSYWREAEGQERPEVFEATCGAWKRQETPGETAERARTVLRAGLERHHAS